MLGHIFLRFILQLMLVPPYITKESGDKSSEERGDTCLINVSNTKAG